MRSRNSAEERSERKGAESDIGFPGFAEDGRGIAIHPLPTFDLCNSSVRATRAVKRKPRSPASGTESLHAKGSGRGARGSHVAALAARDGLTQPDYATRCFPRSWFYVSCDTRRSDRPVGKRERERAERVDGRASRQARAMQTGQVEKEENESCRSLPFRRIAYPKESRSRDEWFFWRALCRANAWPRARTGTSGEDARERESYSRVE